MPRRATAWLATLALLPAVHAQERPFHFGFDVAPWLARQGCAAAECHGGALGRGGFKLSLFGGDPDADWRALTVDRDGRRVDLRNPEHSLMLRKPTLDLPHGGGARLGRGTAAWRALRDWIDAGTPFATEAVPELVGLDLAMQDARLRATARFAWTDPHSGERRGSAEDVTARARFTSSAPDVVDVDRTGRLTRGARGEAWLFARFAGTDASLHTIAPFGASTARPGGAPTPVDAAWLDELDALGLAPAGDAPADTMLRRLYLDLAGRLPTPAERRAFHARPAAERVADTVDVLLADAAFTDVVAEWLARWFDLQGGDPRQDGLRADLRRVAAEDRSLLEAIAARVDTPLFDRLPDPRDRGELFGRAVLGVRLGCARCHDHPLDRWRRADHLGFSALFVDERPAADAGMTSGVLFDTATGAPATARLLPLLGGAGGPAGPGRSRLADALRDHPAAFARNIVNRVVHELLGRGFVEPVDDHRATNPPVQAAMLDALAADFVANGFRIRALVAAVAESGCYARSSDPGSDAGDAARLRAFGRRDARALPEARMRTALALALAVPGTHHGVEAPSPLSMWLSLWNGEDLASLLDAEGNALDALLLFADDANARLDSLFELLLTRTPTASERDRFAPLLADPRAPRDALRSLAHAIALSREFTSIR